MALLNCILLTKCSHTYLVVVLTISFSCLISFTTVNASPANNGRDFIPLQQLLDEEEQVATSLDIKEKPRSLRTPATRFMLLSYEQISGDGNNDGLLENFITDVDKIAINESSEIMTFLNQDDYNDKITNNNGHHFWFNVSKAINNDYLKLAVLRIYQNRSQVKWSTDEEEFTITVYWIVKLNGDEEGLEILSSINTTADYQGWLEIDLTEAFSSWLQHPEGNRGIYIGAHAVAKPDSALKLGDVGLVYTADNEEHQPFMIGFFQGPALISKEVAPALKNLLEQHKRQKRDTQFTTKQPCRLHRLDVTFKELGMDNWVIKPAGFQLNYCSGECTFPLDSNKNATNHALYQAVLHSHKPDDIPEPCCVPTELEGLVMVTYSDDDTFFELKRRKDMIVKSCGCN